MMLDTDKHAHSSVVIMYFVLSLYWGFHSFLDEIKQSAEIVIKTPFEINFLYACVQKDVRSLIASTQKHSSIIIVFCIMRVCVCVYVSYKQTVYILDRNSRSYFQYFYFCLSVSFSFSLSNNYNVHFLHFVLLLPYLISSTYNSISKCIQLMNILLFRLSFSHSRLLLLQINIKHTYIVFCINTKNTNVSSLQTTCIRQKQTMILF